MPSRKSANAAPPASRPGQDPVARPSNTNEPRELVAHLVVVIEPDAGAGFDRVRAADPGHVVGELERLVVVGTLRAVPETGEPGDADGRNAPRLGGPGDTPGMLSSETTSRSKASSRP